MPIYEFKCKTCETKFEKMRAMRDETPSPCPMCGGADTMRLLSLFAAPSNSRNDAACETSAAMGVPCCGGRCAMH